ncbi:MAG: fucose isomerase [Lachnospiraceae bacterium]|nr:fucose isomerase [Lachnospiraceae bacterium]
MSKKNIPDVKIGIVAVSRNCFPESLSVNRRKAVVQSYMDRYDADEIYECPICIVESELHMTRALKDILKEGCNALCVYLGNFGPEIAETMLAEEFSGPVMFCAAAEESQNDLLDGRGDAYCGMLNASYSLGLRGVKAYIPSKPVGTAEKCADMIHAFIPIARTLLGLRSLKIISFGPRPSNFMACNAPIKPLYDLGVEIEENSELDLLESFNRHEGDKRIENIAKEMADELQTGNTMPSLLPKLAQYELTLRDWIRNHKGKSKYTAIAGKCWPAFQTSFGFVPCYVNSRLTADGIPVSCEVDIFGALSEYIGTCISGEPVTLLDINNTVPGDMYEESIRNKDFGGYKYSPDDVFMAFHCGNTASCRIQKPQIKNQRIMARSLPEEMTNGTLEGDLMPGDTTIFRLQGTADSRLQAYMAEGKILPVGTRSFGSIGVFGIKDMARFYRHVLIEKHYPHHAAILFGHYGKTLYEVFRYAGIPIQDIDTNRRKEIFYLTENPYDSEEDSEGII